MGKFFSAISLGFLIVACALLPSCGSSSPTKVRPEVPPTGVSLRPGPDLSLEVGDAVGFSASPAADTFDFHSSNPSVLTIATNGQACAGTWNSLTVPQICTPGPVGTAQVTASTLGVTSPPVTVYVHAPITSKSQVSRRRLGMTAFPRGRCTGQKNGFSRRPHSMEAQTLLPRSVRFPGNRSIRISQILSD